MAIIREQRIIDGKVYIFTFSDNNKMIKKMFTKEVYVEALDVPENNFIYEETEEDIFKEELPE